MPTRRRRDALHVHTVRDAVVVARNDGRTMHVSKLVNSPACQGPFPFHRHRVGEWSQACLTAPQVALALLRDGTRCCCDILASVSLHHPHLPRRRLLVHATPTPPGTGACDAAMPSSPRTSASPAASPTSVYNLFPTRQGWRLLGAATVSRLRSAHLPIPLPAACHIASTLVLRSDRRLRHLSSIPTAMLAGGNEVCLHAGELPFSYK
ncbi:hypothetical protein AURDEDRAFT_177848 [Auricularia subglabra TFB-10046 SS5]|uniref:Uncharacterized protein n=1 Tax=Auricularia subglabra (strain TFB-10046 / SS5) TaxID=717982 RepID=J0D331_AURST|nr:hypothetical protein AURDEDRAFT_177848 [Auricularia subglabra TFB-10046 SS5]